MNCSIKITNSPIFFIEKMLRVKIFNIQIKLFRFIKFNFKYFIL